MPADVSSPFRSRNRGFILPFTILLILGVTAIAVGTLFTSKGARMSSLNYKHQVETFAAADGMMTLLAQEIANGNQNKYLDTTRYGNVYGQVWTGVGGSSVQDLRNRMASQPTPDYKVSSSYLGSNLNLDNYGVKWTGWVVPPFTGTYVFYVRSDDASAFYLSTDETKAQLSTTPLCYLNGWISSWPASGSGISTPVALKAGNHYYFEYLHKEGGGGDYGQVGWDGPDYLFERPITGQHISAYAADSNYFSSTTVGSVGVRYRFFPAGMDRYSLFVEAVEPKVGFPNDTAYRLPLTQTVSVLGQAQAPPDTVWVRTLYYDYHSDYSNPEFEACSGEWWTGMVQPKQFTYDNTNASYFNRTTLPKPVRGPNIYASCGLDKWFRAWQPGDFQIPGYFGGSNFHTCVDVRTVTYDTAYKNAVVRDSIPFIRTPSLGPNTYVFNRAIEPDTQFYPIDNRGFDCAGCTHEKKGAMDGIQHNPSFCTELHTSFTYFSGAAFEFRGDDDVWVFINDSLVLDMGGIHVAWFKYLNLDDLPSLKFGQTYNLDFFGCERGHWGSGFKIVTNLLLKRPPGKPIVSWKRDYGNLD